MLRLSVFLIILLTLVPGVLNQPFGPKYPVTASWFRDRFTYQEWNKTLAEFQAQGGDTVFLRAPELTRRSRDDIARDPDFSWCGSSNSSNGVWGTPCYDEAVDELTSMGLKVVALATYEYEEGFSDALMLCPHVDRKINSSRIYYRIVLPADGFNVSNVCDFKNGSNVVVAFTSFAGTDPHALLLEAAAARNMSVYFGLPSVPMATSQMRAYRLGLQEFDTDMLQAYYGWVYRLLSEHQARYGNMTTTRVEHASPSTTGQDTRPVSQRFGQHVPETTPHRADKPLYTSLAGYYGTDECCLAQVDSNSPYVTLYSYLGWLVHGVSGKKFAISPFIDLNRAQLNATLEQHVQGFETLINTSQIDIIAVQEGRGAGKGCYYWPTQEKLPVSRVDPVLDKIFHYLNPELKENVTFEEICSASNQEVFTAFERSRDRLVGSNSEQLELWLNVEAFEYLRDDPCLPVDPAASGMGELLNRASKGRVDKALTVASARVQKVISFAWDSDYTCTTKKYRSSLAAEIRADFNKPVIANCSFHSPANKSVVLIGYNVGGHVEVNWPARGHRRTDESFGYYFETDWGVQHNRVPSLIYTQLWDLPNVLVDLDYKGWVSVKVKDGGSSCIFEYDFTRAGHDPKRV